MPEFILDHGTPEAARVYNALDDFTQGYVEAMFFTDTGYPENGDLEHATFAELCAPDLERIKSECELFQTANADDLDEATDNGRINGYDMKCAGRDFWYSRNGHGCGYFDRNLGDVGDKLQDIASACKERTLYRGDDDLLHVDRC